MKFLEIYFSRKKKKFEVKYILRISSPDFGKPQKFHDFVFSSPEFGQKSFPGWKRFRQDSITFSNFKISLFKKHFFHHISFITSLVTSKINVGSNLFN